MTSGVFLAILTITSLAPTALCVWLALRVRDLSARHQWQPADPAAFAGLLAELNRRIGRLEDRLGTVEAAGSGGLKRQRRHDRRQEASAEGPVLIAVPSLASVPAGMSSAVATEFDRRFGPIWALADSGANPDAIARETGHPIGQVELILGLRGTRSGAPTGLHGSSARDNADA